MAATQWKGYQPSVQDPAVLAFQQNSHQQQNGGTETTSDSTSSFGTSSSNSQREVGIIEKLLHSYGFIQCTQRDVRLFFHFSEFTGNPDHMEIGDSVEFQMSYDRRTGKPIACCVVKISGCDNINEQVCEDSIEGLVLTEARSGRGGSVQLRGSPQHDGMGRVSYEQAGECFFLPFGYDDVMGNDILHQGDKVLFKVATDKRTGNVRARHLKLVCAAKHDQYQGVVCSMKENYGFIERADVVKEIFFHYSEYVGNINELQLGDDVEFSIQIRNSKDVAVYINKLAEGTVIFEDVGVERRRGRVERTLRNVHNGRINDALSGKIIYETLKGPIEIAFGDKDQKGDFTLNEGDLVEFNIATDRRDQLQRATNISLIPDTFKVNSECRMVGFVTKLNDGFGFINAGEFRAFFRYQELLEPEVEVQISDQVEYSMTTDSNGRQVATRILRLSLSDARLLSNRYTGTVEKVAAQDGTLGEVKYQSEGKTLTIPYNTKVVHGQTPKVGSKVDFQVLETANNGIKSAANLKLKSASITSTTRRQGFIATLKDNFGFLETITHDKEVFFHFSSFEGNIAHVDLGDEVEYSLSKKMSRVSAENIVKLQAGTICPEEVMEEVLEGKVTRCMRIVNPEQDDYPGIVEATESSNCYPFGITSLADKRDFLQPGDKVKFQLAKLKSSDELRATNIAAIRNHVKAKVDSVKGAYGFLAYEVENGKKLFFHMTEVHDGYELQPGDDVQFVVVKNQRNGKYSACSLRKVEPTTTPRPERLLSRLKSSEEHALRVAILRQPLGPDGTVGFEKWKKSNY